ncbi:MAG: hypothetical protein ACLSVD_02100 [Eggerthellaceae bacterium]
MEIVTEKLPPEPEAASGTEAAAASAQDDRPGLAQEAQAHEIDRGEVRPAPRSRRRPARAAACPTKALRLIDAQFAERAQNKRKAVARASASFASMKLTRL